MKNLPEFYKDCDPNYSLGLEPTAKEARAEIYKLFCGKAPPDHLLGELSSLDSTKFIELTKFIDSNLTHCQWLHPVELILSVEKIVAKGMLFKRVRE